MANYTHQGPGPSSYYQQPPPVYGGGHSPGPRPPNFYPYPPQFHHHHHPPPPPRGNHPRGSYGSRGYYQQQAPYAAHYPAKYNPPSYHYPSPNAPVFTPSWQQQQQQQPISPLPKQLSMPVPITPQEPPTESETPPPLPLPPQTPPPTSSSYTHMGSISTAHEPNQPISNSGIAKWAIWSRRPQDPTLAPSIIISPKARPPPDIVSQASDLKTPPPSPPPPRSPPLLPTKPPLLPSTPLINPIVDLSQPPLPADEAQGVAWASLTNSTVPSSSVTEKTDTPTQTGSPASSHTSLSVASTKDGKDVGSSKEVDSMSAEEETPPNIPMSAEKTAVVPATSTAPTPSTTAVPPREAAPSTSAATPVAPPPSAPPKKSWASLLRPSTSASGSASAGPSRNALPTSSVVGISIPAASASVQDAALHVSPSRKTELVRLLTSGPGHATAISYAGSAASTPITNLTPSTKIRPRGLINSGNMCFANSVLQIMVYCPPFHRLFAELGRVFGGSNSSGGLGVSSQGMNGINGMAGKNGDGTAAEASAYPLVEATVEFLREFVVDEDRSKDLKEKGKANANVNGRVASGSALAPASSSRTSSSRGGKGKERERGDSVHDVSGGGAVGRREDDDGWTESFLPTYVYDAMKVKKRFEHMRGGHQEDAEEFFGFYLDTLEEELLAMLAAVSAPPPSTSANTSSTNSALGKNAKLGSVTGTGTAAAVNTESESVVSHEDADGDGWLEVGKRNRTVVTRTIKGTESPITRIFGGKFRSTLRAPGQKDSVLVEDWRSLRLDIQHDQIHTIQDALSYISHPQTVQITLPTQSQSQSHVQQKPVNAAHTQHQQQQTINAQQQVLIEALPPVLVLHIKRFCYDKESGGVVKVGKRVRFSGELDIGSDVMVPAAKKSQPVRYKLFGVLYHHGMSASGGHYTLDVLHPDRYPASSLLSSSSGSSYSSSLSISDFPRASSAPATSTSTPSSREGWVRIDDDVVVDVRPEDVFGFGGDRERDETRCAYLLFYRRV